MLPWGASGRGSGFRERYLWGLGGDKSPLYWMGEWEMGSCIWSLGLRDHPMAPSMLLFICVCRFQELYVDTAKYYRSFFFISFCFIFSLCFAYVKYKSKKVIVKRVKKNICIQESFYTNILHQLFFTTKWHLWVHNSRTQIKKVNLYSKIGFKRGIQK
jgi:hypothetical protein